MALFETAPRVSGLLGKIIDEDGQAQLSRSGGGGIGDAAFGSISPDNGKQESTEVDVEITCDNTTFLDDGVNDIIFIPDNGLTVENIRVDNDTTIKFNLKMAVDAPEGDRL